MTAGSGKEVVGSVLDLVGSAELESSEDSHDLTNVSHAITDDDSLGRQQVYSSATCAVGNTWQADYPHALLVAQGLLRMSPAGADTALFDPETLLSGGYSVGALARDAAGDFYLGGFDAIGPFILRIPLEGVPQFVMRVNREADPSPPVAPRALAVATDSTIYAAGGTRAESSVYRVHADGAWEPMVGAEGDGQHAMHFPTTLVAAPDGSVLIGVAAAPYGVFRLAPDGTVTRIIGPEGDGTHPLGELPVQGQPIAGAPDGTVYVAGNADNVFRIDADGTILDGTGDGVHPLDGPYAIATGPDGSVYVAGGASDNLFRLRPIPAGLPGTGSGGLAAEPSGSTPPHAVMAAGALALSLLGATSAWFWRRPSQR